jgi:RHS repeat-associated protein
MVIDAATQNSVQRRQTPFGTPRGPAGAMPTDKTFAGGTSEPTGLILLGARQYDPGTGRFVSVDPLIDLSDPQQIPGYAYADNSPVTQSDPTGFRAVCGDPTGDCGSPTSGAAQAPTGSTVVNVPAPPTAQDGARPRPSSGFFGWLDSAKKTVQSKLSALTTIVKPVYVNVTSPGIEIGPGPGGIDLGGTGPGGTGSGGTGSGRILITDTGDRVVGDTGGRIGGGGRQPQGGLPPWTTTPQIDIVANNSGSEEEPVLEPLPNGELDPEAVGIPAPEIDDSGGGADPSPIQPPSDAGSHQGAAGDAHQGTQGQDGTTHQGAPQQAPGTTTGTTISPQPVYEAPQTPPDAGIDGIGWAIAAGLAIIGAKITRRIR